MVLSRLSMFYDVNEPLCFLKKSQTLIIPPLSQIGVNEGGHEPSHTKYMVGSCEHHMTSIVGTPTIRDRHFMGFPGKDTCKDHTLTERFTWSG